MPAVPFIAVALGASGALTAIGTAIAGMAGLSVATGTVAASLAAGTISTAAATAIGAGTFAGLSTAIQGGKPSQILKSAVLGGVTSYAGSAIAGSIANSVASSATGVSPTIAAAMGRVAGSAVSGAITSGTSALLTGKGDPIQALLKGGITAAFSAGVGESVNAVLSKVPALANPLNNTEAAINRAMSAAIGTAIVSGGDVNKIGTAVLNSFAATAGGLIGQQIRDSSSQLSNANEQFRASERAYANNIQSQESLVNQYNAAIQPLISGKAQIDALIPQYDAIVWKYYNYHDWLTSEGYELRTTFGEYGSESYYVKPRYTQYGLVEDPLPESMYSDALARQAKAIESQVTSLAQNLNSQYTSLFGGEVTKYKTETQLELVQEGWGDAMNQYWVEREVQVPYTETVTGSLTPIKNQIDQLKSQTETLGQNYASAKTNLENAVANFNTTETANAAIVEQQLQNFTTARDQYKQQFGKEPTEEQLTNFARTGDILGTVGKLIADDRNENFAKEAGFRNYADFTAAGQVAPNEFYAKQQGWNSYAEQLKAQGMGLNTPQQYTTYQNNEQTAISQGFANYQDLQAAGNLSANDFYAKQSGWESYAQKQEAESSGLYSPSAWTNYQTEQKNQTLATNAGFPDYKTYEQFGGDKIAYNSSELLQDQIDSANLTPEEKEAVKNAMQDVYRQSAVAQALPKAFAPPTTDVGTTAPFKIGTPFAANDPRFYDAMVKNPSLAKAFGEYTNAYGFGTGGSFANQQYLSALNRALQENPSDQNLLAEYKRVTGSDYFQSTAGGGRGTVNPPLVTPDQSASTTKPITPTNVAKPSDYSDTTEEIQPWQNIPGGLQPKPGEQTPPITNEDQIIKFLQDNGVPPTPELVASIAKDAGVKLTDPVTSALSPALDVLGQSMVGPTPAPAPAPIAPPAPVAAPVEPAPAPIAPPVSAPVEVPAPAPVEAPAPAPAPIEVPAPAPIATPAPAAPAPVAPPAPVIPTPEIPTATPAPAPTTTPAPAPAPSPSPAPTPTTTPSTGGGAVSSGGTGAVTGGGAGTGTTVVPGADITVSPGPGTGTGTGTGTKTGPTIEDVLLKLEEQQKEEEERQRQEQERQKVEAARSLVSSARNAAEQRMTSGAAAMSALAALGSVGRGAPDEFKPLLPQFLTSKGGQTGYRGLLEDFQQQVEGRTDMPDNQVSQESQGSKDMAPYYSYGNETSLDQILGQDQESQQFAAGGLAQPLMAAGTRYGKYAAGGMPSPLMAAGGKMRVDFRDGDAVTGPGDGQSDDIPAMLADGEFVWPSDVVAALGNGSTKAGSDKLYEMMHAIRARARSTGPKDLPPPALKSPLDYLKKRNKNASKKR